jgi:hypothetical protein
MSVKPITLAQAAQAARRADAAQAKADDRRDDRDRMIVALNRQGVPHRVIAEAVGLSLPAVGKVTRAGGIIRWHRTPPARRRDYPVCGECGLTHPEGACEAA